MDTKYRQIKARIAAKLKKDRDASTEDRKKEAERGIASPMKRAPLTKEQGKFLRGHEPVDRVEHESYNELEKDEETKKTARQFRHLRQNS